MKSKIKVYGISYALAFASIYICVHIIIIVVHKIIR